MIRAVVTTVLLISLLPVQAGELDDRVKRLERMVNSGTLLELLDKVEQLQNTVRELRGEIEQQRHTLTKLKKHQRELYLDIDRRLQATENRTTPVPAVAITANPAPAQTNASLSGSNAAGSTAGSVKLPLQPATSISSRPAAGSTVVNADPGKQQAEYKSAFDLLKEGRYNQASKAFQAFLEHYPKGDFSDNAQYWLAETYYVTRQFKPALKEFNKLVREHPDSQKISHAKLKIGYIYHEMGDLKQARATLQALTKDYPDSTPARLAKERLNRINNAS